MSIKEQAFDIIAKQLFLTETRKRDGTMVYECDTCIELTKAQFEIIKKAKNITK